jgi:predicted nuclease of predicted toxin-antitoxin system
MRLYLDDDSVNPLLARLLRNAGHDVQLPQVVGLSGEPDSVHLTHAIRDTRVLLTKNYNDFERLHNLVAAAQGQHPGILVVRQDNDSKRDLTPRGIVRAIAKLEAAGVPIANSYHVLNQWR